MEDIPSKGSEGEKNSRESLKFLRYYLNSYHQNVGRNISGKGNFYEVPNGNEEQSVRTSSKGHPSDKVAKDLIEFPHAQGLCGKQNLKVIT